MWWAGVVWVGVVLWLYPHVGTTTAVLLGAAAAVLTYWVDVQIHPWTSCWLCGGDSKVRDSKGTSWGYCVKCGGSGKRRRLFARKES